MLAVCHQLPGGPEAGGARPKGEKCPVGWGGVWGARLQSLDSVRESLALQWSLPPCSLSARVPPSWDTQLSQVPQGIREGPPGCRQQGPKVEEPRRHWSQADTGS